MQDNAGNTIEVGDDEQVTVTLTYFDNQAVPQMIQYALHDLIEKLLNNTIAS